MPTTDRPVDVVVHNAGQYEFGLDRAGRERMQAINVTGTDNVLGLARELGIPRSVYVSTVVAFSETGTPMRDETFTRQAPCRTFYERSKTDAHEIALRYQQIGLPLIICALMISWTAAREPSVDREAEKRVIAKIINDSICWALTKNRALQESTMAHDEDLFVLWTNSKSAVTGWSRYVKLFDQWMDPEWPVAPMRSRST